MSQLPDETLFRRLRRSPVVGIVAAVLFVALLLGLLVRSGGHEHILDLLHWVERQGLWAPLFFILIMAATVVLVLPGLPLTAGAGFVFGVVAGSIYVVLGTTLGAVLSFVIARYFFGTRARRYMLSHKRLRAVGEEMTPHGGKIVLLTRLIPFFPSKLANYFFGLTPVYLRDYTLGSLVGFIPFSVHNVYLGSIAADLSTMTVRDLGRTPLQWALYGGGFVVTVITVVWLNRLAQRALRPYMHEENGSKETQP
ncbi:TVP38/TMEM64 family protein [Thioalkalivibrio sp. XN279]|uniref:TVP38/TMEM64 family protein n=1 Tax=Thioalkalivibrio sp. XN279 TaxID=2714953 RepID=UPI0014099C4D|nr:TVP38/TMEM64 family protein [Thioalkalivibrio sp. XN279]NHA15405.1 TVP38/TMEM64 family protein [Thioalkalivibrio sp. XN279]